MDITQSGLPNPEPYKSFQWEGKTWQPYSQVDIESRSYDTYPNIWECGNWHLTLLNEYEFRHGGESGKHWRIERRDNGERTICVSTVALEMALKIACD